MKKKNIICYSISIVLIVSYFAILGLNLKIKAPIEYKLYYIKKEIAGWPGYGGMEIDFNTKKYFNEDAFEDKEIYQAVNKGMMKDALGKKIHDVGEVYFTVPKDYTGSKIKVRVNMKGLEDDNTVSITLNDQELTTVKTSEEYKDYDFVIDESMLNSDKNILRFTPTKHTNLKSIEFFKD